MILQLFSRAQNRLVKVAKSLALKDLFVLGTLLFSLAANIVMWAYIGFHVEPSANPVPLHFNIYFGVDYIDFWYKIFYIPLIGLITLCVNFVLIYKFYLKEKILSYVLCVGNVLVHIFLSIATFLIVSINI